MPGAYKPCDQRPLQVRRPHYTKYEDSDLHKHTTADEMPTVSGGAGAVGTCIGKAVLESGGDAAFFDILSSPDESTWRKLCCTIR